MSFIAVLDANVLWPAALRCTLVRAAINGLYRPAWTHRILEEMRLSLIREGKVDPERIARTIHLLSTNVPHIFVEGYGDLIPAMMNHEKDRHILAAAVRIGAGTIVTSNVRHFPAHSRAPYNVAVHAPDDFLCDLWDLDAVVMARILEDRAAQLHNPPMSARQVAAGMRGIVPVFAQTALDSGMLSEDTPPGTQPLLESSPIYG